MKIGAMKLSFIETGTREKDIFHIFNLSFILYFNIASSIIKFFVLLLYASKK